MGFISLTVPAAGESESFPITGISIEVTSAPAYQSNDAAPKLSFDDPGDNLPIRDQGKLPNAAGEFQKVIVTGTTESAGDTIELVSWNLCIEPRVNPDLGQNKKSIAGTTASKAASDSVQSFSQAELSDADGNLPSKLYVYVIGGATRGINYAFNADPSQGYPPTDSYYWNNEESQGGASQPSPMEPLEIEGIDWILSFRFIASVLGETPDLIRTPEY